MTENNITRFYPKDAAKEPDNVLEQALGVYSDVLILGWDKEGRFDPRASLDLDKADMLLLIEIFKHNLISGVYNDDEQS